VYGNENHAPITAAHETQADSVIELQMEKAGIRLARLLDPSLLLNAHGRIVAPKRGSGMSGSVPFSTWTYYGQTTIVPGVAGDAEVLSPSSASSRRHFLPVGNRRREG